MTSSTTRKGRGGRYLAATVAAAALITTGGVLAGWEADETVRPGSVTAGEMRLEEINSSWEWADGSTFDPLTEALVPGDEVIYREAVEVTATAPGMVGTMTTSMDDIVGETDADADLAALLAQEAEFEVDGVTYDGGARTVTHNDHGAVLDVALTVIYPADATDGMAQAAFLGDVHVLLRQGIHDDIPGGGGDGTGEDEEAPSVAELISRFETAAVSKSTASSKVSLLTFVPAPEDETTTIRDAAEAGGVGWVLSQLEGAGIDLDAPYAPTLADAQAVLDQATTDADGAMSAVYAAGGTFTLDGGYLNPAPVVRQQLTEWGLFVDPVYSAYASGTAGHVGFRVVLDGSEESLPGYSGYEHGMLSLSPSQAGEWTWTYTIEEVYDGTVVATTPVTATITVTDPNAPVEVNTTPSLHQTGTSGEWRGISWVSVATDGQILPGQPRYRVVLDGSEEALPGWDGSMYHLGVDETHTVTYRLEYLNPAGDTVLEAWDITLTVTIEALDTGGGGGRFFIYDADGMGHSVPATPSEDLHAVLDGVDFTGVKIHAPSLAWAVMTDVTLTGTDLRGVDLSHATHDGQLITGDLLDQLGAIWDETTTLN